MLRKSTGIALISSIPFRAQFFHSSYQVYKKSAQPASDQSAVKIIDPIKKETLSQLHKRFQCSIEEASSLYDILKFPKQNWKDIILKKAWLTGKGASTSVIRVNCEILLHTSKNLRNRFNALKSVHWKKTDDFLPLLIMNEEAFFKVRFVNRIYELSERLNMEPHIISRSCVKHPFIFDLSDSLFRRKLEIVLSQPISANAILRDLEIFRRSEKALQKRFEFLAEKNIGRILPWMVKSSDEAIKRLIRVRSNQTKNENETLEHLAEWLDLHGNTARRLLSEHRVLTILDVKELTQRMEYLLKLIEPKVIAENINLLCYPLDNLKLRADELKSLGMTDIAADDVRKMIKK